MNSTSNPAISVIVPVYKAEKYIHRCLDSIINQTFKDFELILVDDGSPDRSGEICDEYAAKDKRVKVIHKENGGVASARQCGIDAATGEYTIHADPDDWMELDMLKCMYNAIKEDNADLLITDFYFNKENKEIYCKQPIRSLKQEDILKSALTELHGSMCNKLLKTSIYKENNIKFIESIDFCEDVLFWLQILQSQNLKINHLQKAFYHYDLFSNNCSITRKGSQKMAIIMEKYIYNLEILVPDKFYKEMGTSIINTLAHAFLLGIKIKQYKSYFKKYKQYIDFIPISNINQILFRLSYYNISIAYKLYNIKKKFHFLIKRFFNIKH